MAIHYLGDIIHVTCATRSGRRRSPMSDIAYNSGQTLTDLATGRTHARPHTDGTEIIATDIVCTSPCPYGDTSVPSALRREWMYYELYCLNKKNTERVYWKTVIALPNELDAEQLKVVGRDIAMALSCELNRPVDYSIHMKRDNYHMHITVPERKYKNGWGAKSVSFYINKDGTLNTSKVYKDIDGNDVRMPRTINREAPIYSYDNTGHVVCVNQARGLHGSRLWKMRDLEGLHPEQLSRMHDLVDSIQNEYLQKLGYSTIQRNDPRTRRDLKELGISAAHFGKRDTEAKGTSYHNKVVQNKQYRHISTLLNEQYYRQDLAEQRLKEASLAERTGENQLRALSEERRKADNDILRLKGDTEEAGMKIIRAFINIKHTPVLDETMHVFAAIAKTITEQQLKVASQNQPKTTQQTNDNTKTGTEQTVTESRWGNNEYKRSSKIRNERLAAWRNEVIEKYTDKLYTERSLTWQNYLKAKQPVDKAHKKLLRIIELENGAGPENDMVSLRQEQYEKEQKKFMAIYPVAPKEPDRAAIRKGAEKQFGKLSADLLEQRIKRLKLQVPEHFAQAYKDSDMYVQECWKRTHATDRPGSKKIALKPKGTSNNMSRERT